MSSELRACATGALLLLWASAAGAQSTLDRSPDLSGGWTGIEGQAYFHFLHRFQSSPAPARKVSSSPTFLLAYAPADRLLLGMQYATSSDVVPNYPNEWAAFARWGVRPGLAVQGGYDVAAKSADGAVDARRSFGPFRVLATVRGFSAAFGDAAAAALGGGVVWQLGFVALAGDYVKLLSRPEKGAWSAALQLRIPASPHTVSLQATNANTATLQGSTRGSGVVRYGFEFTIPLTLARYFGASRRDTVQARDRDTVTVEIHNLKFTPDVIEVSPGTRVRWVNLDPLDHSVTAAGGQWDSGLIKPNATYERVFTTAGEYAYACTPHPFMKGRVLVRTGGAQ